MRLSNVSLTDALSRALHHGHDLARPGHKSPLARVLFSPPPQQELPERPHRRQSPRRLLLSASEHSLCGGTGRPQLRLGGCVQLDDDLVQKVAAEPRNLHAESMWRVSRRTKGAAALSDFSASPSFPTARDRLAWSRRPAVQLCPSRPRHCASTELARAATRPTTLRPRRCQRRQGRELVPPRRPSTTSSGGDRPEAERQRRRG